MMSPAGRVRLFASNRRPMPRHPLDGDANLSPMDLYTLIASIATLALAILS